MFAGWIRFRASLMAMRRTSWIDQRINDGVAVLVCLRWFGVAFFLAAADWRDGGLPPSWRRRASPGKRGDATHARIYSPATILVRAPLCIALVRADRCQSR